jgi:hypothetical protein
MKSSMTANFIGPYVIRVPYSSCGLSHNMQLNVDVVGAPTPGTPMVDIEFYNKGGGIQAADDALDDFFQLVRVGYTNAVTFGPAELFYVIPTTEMVQWITAGVDTWTGNNAGSNVPASELILTYRTYEGGVMRQSFLESANAGTAHTALGSRGIGTFEGDLWRYTVDDGNWVLAKDTSYPIAPLFMCQGENEVLWRKHYRS